MSEFEEWDSIHRQVWTSLREWKKNAALRGCPERSKWRFTPMTIPIPINDAEIEQHLPASRLDGSGIGINYADALVKPIKLTLPDGRKVACKRRGLKVTFTLGDRTGEGLIRRLEHGPEERNMVREALREAARGAGARVEFEPGAILLSVEG